MFLQDDFIPGAASHVNNEAEAYCAACFDLEDIGSLEREMRGIGVCVYDTKLNEFRRDGRFFGTIEAKTGTSFKFLDLEEQDWDFDAGYAGTFSKISGTTSAFNARFVSKPKHMIKEK